MATVTPQRAVGGAPQRSPVAIGRRPPLGRAARRERLAGYVFLSPWLVGFMAITAAPMLFSLYLSFTDYDTAGPWSGIRWVGLDNYRRMFTQDPTYWHSVRVTFLFVLVVVPLKLGAALGVALLLRRPRPGAGLLRGLFYLPSLLGSSVALALVWFAMFSDTGSFNTLLSLVGIDGRAWVSDPSTALGTIVVLAVWQFGAPMVIFLAGLNLIPAHLYESAAVDGAGRWQTFRTVTLPMLSPVLFFNLVLETISGFQGFTSAYIVSNGTGGPVDSTMLYTLYLYIKGFNESEMGYACALAWVFLVFAALVTRFFFRTGRLWVHYAHDWSR